MHIRQGWLQEARHCPSPNFNARPVELDIDLLVIHAISLPPCEFGSSAIVDFFSNQLDHDAHPYFAGIRDLRVSAHCLIKRDGELLQFVSFNDRAWHAGRSVFQGRTECNDFSIGVELEGCDHQAFAARQYRTLAALTRAIQRCYPAITDAHIVGHSDIAPGRKTDPGPYFDWENYRNQVRKI